MKNKHIVVIGLGGNIGDRKKYLDDAIFEIEHSLNGQAICSKIYESKAWGFKSEARFLNCCIYLETNLNPVEVLAATQAIENKLGRVKKSKNKVYQSRVIDLDILYFDDLILETEKLIIPHPLIYDRMFVIRPLTDILPAHIDPVKNMSISELLANCNDENEVLLYNHKTITN